MERARPQDLGEGVWRFQSSLWQTNSLLAEAGGEILLCDPAFSHAEIEAIRAETERRRAGAIRLVVTHADFDHTCGIPYFPAAEVIAGEETAAKIGSGAAEESLRTYGPPWGGDWPDTALRIDNALPAGQEAECGAFRMAVIDSPSHGREGSAYVLLDQGILLPGDHISAMTYPFLGGSVARAIEANERLLEAIDRHDLRWVVPGHGPALAPAEARQIGEKDLAYLRRLEAAARKARAAGLPDGYALLEVYEVEPPRETTPDFEVYELRTSNARRVLEELALR